jgi:hypothetical protein
VPGTGLAATEQIAFADHADERAGVINDRRRANTVGEQDRGDLRDVAVGFQRAGALPTRSSLSV